jgi:hypothetical protein
MVDVRRLEIVTPARSGVGVVMRVRSELFGLPVVRDVMEITRWEPPHRLDVRHRGQFHGSGSFVLEASGDGTLFTWSEEVAPPLGVLGEVAFALVIRPHLGRVFSRSLDNLRFLAEARAAAAR